MLPILKVYGITATIAVDPPVSNVTIGDTFNVNINVTNIVNFTCWQLRLYFLKGVLNCTAAIGGPFLVGPNGTYYDKTITNNFNATHGELLAFATLNGNFSVAGSGTILTVTFKAVGGGNTPLHMADIKLGDEKIPPQPIPHTTVDGMVDVTSGVIHDVAVTNVTSFKTVVCQGYTSNITVTVENQGGFLETFNVTVYANTTAIETQTVNSMPNGTSTILTFTWDTSGFAKGKYTISAYAWPVPGETDTADNNFTGGWVRVSMVGDLTGGTPNPWDFVPDGKVDGKDIAIVALCFGSAPGCPPPYIWNPNSDVNNDVKIDGKDIATVALHFGQADP
jgi:hypothetical protein